MAGYFTPTGGDLSFIGADKDRRQRDEHFRKQNSLDASRLLLDAMNSGSKNKLDRDRLKQDDKHFTSDQQRRKVDSSRSDRTQRKQISVTRMLGMNKDRREGERNVIAKGELSERERSNKANESRLDKVADAEVNLTSNRASALADQNTRENELHGKRKTALEDANNLNKRTFEDRVKAVAADARKAELEVNELEAKASERGFAGLTEPLREPLAEIAEVEDILKIVGGDLTRRQKREINAIKDEMAAISADLESGAIEQGGDLGAKMLIGQLTRRARRLEEDISKSMDSETHQKVTAFRQHSNDFLGMEGAMGKAKIQQALDDTEFQNHLANAAERMGYSDPDRFVEDLRAQIFDPDAVGLDSAADQAILSDFLNGIAKGEPISKMVGSAIAIRESQKSGKWRIDEFGNKVIDR